MTASGRGASIKAATKQLITTTKMWNRAREKGREREGGLLQCIIDSSINVSMGKRGERGGAGALACVVGCVVDFQFHTHRWMSAFYRLTHLSAKCHPELTPVQSVPAAIFITCAVIKMYFLPMCSLMGSIRSCSRGGHSRTSLSLCPSLCHSLSPSPSL